MDHRCRIMAEEIPWVGLEDLPGVEGPQRCIQLGRRNEEWFCVAKSLWYTSWNQWYLRNTQSFVLTLEMIGKKTIYLLHNFFLLIGRLWDLEAEKWLAPDFNGARVPESEAVEAVLGRKDRWTEISSPLEVKEILGDHGSSTITFCAHTQPWANSLEVEGCDLQHLVFSPRSSFMTTHFDSFHQYQNNILNISSYCPPRNL